MIDYKFNVLRINADGTLDADFTVYQGDYADVIVVDKDGKKTIVNQYIRSGKVNKDIVRSFSGTQKELEQIIDKKLANTYATYGSPITEQAAEVLVA